MSAGRRPQIRPATRRPPSATRHPSGRWAPGDYSADITRRRLFESNKFRIWNRFSIRSPRRELKWITSQPSRGFSLPQTRFVDRTSSGIMIFPFPRRPIASRSLSAPLTDSNWMEMSLLDPSLCSTTQPPSGKIRPRHASLAWKPLPSQAPPSRAVAHRPA